MMKSMLKFSAFAAVVVLGTSHVATADSITGTMVTPTLNTNGVYDISKDTTDWVYFGASTVTKNGGPGSFSGATGGNMGGGGDSQVFVSYSGGTPTDSATDSRIFSWGGSESFTHTLLANTENLSVYLVGFSTRADITATLSGSGASYSVTDVNLPATDGNGSGLGHVYGILNLAVSGTKGDTLSFSVTSNAAGVLNDDGSAYTGGGNIGLQAASVTVPEPATGAISLGAALVAFMAYAWRKRK